MIYKLFLTFVLLIFVGCESPPDIKPKFVLGEKVLLLNNTPAMVVYKNLTYHSGEYVYYYQVKYADSHGGFHTDWFHEFELEKAD